MMTKRDMTLWAVLAVTTGWLLGGCGALFPPDPNIVVGSNGQPVNTDAVARILYDPQYANEDAKRTALEALGLTPESAQYCLDHPEKVIGVGTTAFQIELQTDKQANPQVEIWNQADFTSSLEVTLTGITTSEIVTRTWTLAPGEGVFETLPPGQYLFKANRSGLTPYEERPWLRLGFLYKYGNPPG